MSFLFFIVAFALADWHVHDDTPIYTSCGIMKTVKKVFAGTSDTETPLEQDSAQLYDYESSEPEFSYICHNGHVASSKLGEVMACLQYDRVNLVTALFVWIGKEPKLSYTTILEDVLYVANPPAIVISHIGDTIAVLGSDGQSAVLYLFDPLSETPTNVWKSEKSEKTQVQHLTISRNGKIIAFHHDEINNSTNSNPTVKVYEKKKSDVIWKIDLPYSTNGLALSENGDYLAFGFIGFSLYKREKDSYTEVYTKKSPSHEYFFQAIVNNKGEMIVGLSSYENLSPSIKNFDDEGNEIWTYQYGVSDQLQDVPYVMEYTDDGKHFVVGTWGNQTEANPQVRIFDITNDTPLKTFSTPGSVFCADIVRHYGYLYVVAGGKTVHANEMGRGGELFFYEVKL